MGHFLTSLEPAWLHNHMHLLVRPLYDSSVNRRSIFPIHMHLPGMQTPSVRLSFQRTVFTNSRLQPGDWQRTGGKQLDRNPHWVRIVVVDLIVRIEQ